MDGIRYREIIFLLGISSTIPLIDSIYVPIGIWRYIPYGESSYNEFLAVFTERNNCTGQLGSWFPTIMDFKVLGKEGACSRGEKYIECSKNAKAINVPKDFKTIISILARNNARLTKYACENYDSIKLGLILGTIRCGSMTLAEAETKMSFYSHEILSYYVIRMSRKSFQQKLPKAAASFHNAMKDQFPDGLCTKEAIALRDKFIELVDYA